MILGSILYIWNDQNLKSRELEIKVRNELGVDQQVVTSKEIHDLEPNINYNKLLTGNTPTYIYIYILVYTYIYIICFCFC